MSSENPYKPPAAHDEADQDCSKSLAANTLLSLAFPLAAGLAHTIDNRLNGTMIRLGWEGFLKEFGSYACDGFIIAGVAGLVCALNSIPDDLPKGALKAAFQEHTLPAFNKSVKATSVLYGALALL